VIFAKFRKGPRRLAGESCETRYVGSALLLQRIPWPPLSQRALPIGTSGNFRSRIRAPMLQGSHPAAVATRPHPYRWPSRMHQVTAGACG
jgi:hypothetical protein